MNRLAALAAFLLVLLPTFPPNGLYAPGPGAYTAYMRFSAVLVGVALAAAPAPATAEVAVRVSGGHVDLTATAAPLADVLDRLARQTGMKVVYEGPAPRQLVTLSLHGRTPTETVLSVLEGLGVNFALMADPSGAHVQTLVVAGTATASSSPSAAATVRPASARRAVFGPPPAASPETVDPALEEMDEEPTADEEALGAEVTDPGGAPVIPPDAIPANPASQGPPVPVPLPGAGIPAQPTQRFSPSPFMPQPQPFPPLPATVPAAPAGSPPAGEGATPANPPPQ
jgi:hypothetical protein